MTSSFKAISVSSANNLSGICQEECGLTVFELACEWYYFTLVSVYLQPLILKSIMYVFYKCLCLLFYLEYGSVYLEGR